MKKILLAAFLFSTVTAAYPQPAGNDGKGISGALQKLRWDLNLGTSFTFIPEYGGNMNYFAAPGFSYPAGERISLHGGIVTGISTAPYFSGEENEFQKTTSGFTSVYGSVAYHLNQNLVFYGTGVKNLASFGPPGLFHTPAFNEISFGSSLRLGDNITIGASVHFREYSPLNSSFYSPRFFK